MHTIFMPKKPPARDRALLLTFASHLAEKLKLEFDRRGLEGYVDEFLYRSLENPEEAE